jgi:hypothetical protein
LAGFHGLVESAADFIPGLAQRCRQDVLQNRAVTGDGCGMSNATAHDADPDNGHRLHCGH